MYPKIEDNNFYKNINNIYKKYEIPKTKKTFKETCFPKKYELQIQQKFLPEYVNPKTPYKSLLIYHKIGAGKTCTAIKIAEKWIGKKKIIVVVPASLIGNFRNELRSGCVKHQYITELQLQQLANLHPSTNEYKKIIKETDKLINKYYHIYSYNKFASELQNKTLKLHNCLLIIDEIQNMISETGTYYKQLKNAIKQSKNSRFVFMSATPMFDKPGEIALLLNLLNPNGQLKTGDEFVKRYINITRDDKDKLTYTTKHLNEIQKFAKGYVSYYRGAPPFAFPTTDIKIVKCEMSSYQYRAYKSVLHQENKMETQRFPDKKNVLQENIVSELPNNFFIGSRIISNIVYPNMKINKTGLDLFQKKHANLTELENYSIKFFKILKKIKKAKGPVFIYSNFKEFGGIMALQKVLNYNNYKNYAEHGEGKNRFAIWSSDESTTLKDEIRNVYNNSENKSGKLIKILLGSPSIKEGVSLLRVSQIHILEPTWNWSKLDQIIGRGVRFCSHRDLPMSEREVKVYIYIATSPKKEITTDQYILNLAIQKQKLISDFELILKQSAIDCKLFKHANYYPKIDKHELKCVL